MGKDFLNTYHIRLQTPLLATTDKARWFFFKVALLGFSHCLPQSPKIQAVAKQIIPAKPIVETGADGGQRANINVIKPKAKQPPNLSHFT